MKKIIQIVAVFSLVLAACGGADPVTAPADVEDSSPTPQATDGSEATQSTQASAAPSAGSATLTIDGVVYEFDNYYCAMGTEATGNDRVSFSSGAFGEVDGSRVQLDASIQDTDEQGRMSGDGTLHSVTLDDVDDFENPVVGWTAVTGFVTGAAWEVVSDGVTVTATAVFDNSLTPETEAIETIEGVLVATCGG